MAQVPYNPTQAIGSVVQTDTHQPNDYFSVHATPENFGGQVGQAVQGLGKAVDNDAAAAMKIQGINNETDATNAENEFIKKAGVIKANALAKEGKDAADYFPQYEKDLEAVRQEVRGNLSGGALKMYDSLTTRQTANYTSDYASYSAIQKKNYQLDAHLQSIDLNVLSGKDPYVYNNPDAVDNAIGNIKYEHGATLDENSPGLKADENGNYDFDKSTPEGQIAYVNHKNAIDNSVGQFFTNAVTSAAEQDPLNAKKIFDDNKYRIPAAYQANIQAFLQPAVENHQINQNADSAIFQAKQNYQYFLQNHVEQYNNSSQGPSSYNLGNVKTPQGAASGSADFVNPATPVDGVILAANTLRKSYRGLKIAEIGDKWAPPSENETSDWVSNVSKVSGLAPDAVPDLNDPKQLQAVLKGISTAEKSPKDRANFTDDVISQGVQASLSGKQPTSGPAKPYPTNPDGSKFTDVDYLASHKAEILDYWAKKTEEQFPGNLRAQQATRERVDQLISKSVSDQAIQYKQDNEYVSKAIYGGLTNNTPPGSYQELMAIPGVKEVVGRVNYQDPKFAEGIDTMIAHAQKRNDVSNSPNAFETIQRVLESGPENTNKIGNQDQLDKLMGRSDGTGINAKDYNDAKKGIEAPETIKTFVKQTMNSIAEANGNIDGQGKQRAINWYNQAMSVYQKASTKPDFDENKFLDSLKDSVAPHAPSRMDQITNWVKSLGSSGAKQPPVLTDKAQFDALPSGSIYIRDNVQYRKP